jgi:hypothetical protein
MRRLSLILLLLMAMPTLPALAQEGDPLAHSTLLPQAIGWALAGLAVLLVILFILWTRRNPG